MSSDTIRLIAEIFRRLRRNDRVCAVVPGSAEILSVLRHCGRLRLDLLQTDPSVYDGAGLDLFLQPCSSSFCRAASRYTSAAR